MNLQEFEKDAEKYVDGRIMGFKNRKGTARKLTAMVLALVLCSFALGAWIY